MKISKEAIIDFFRNGGKVLGDLAWESFGEALNQIGADAFSDAIEIGIENTIAALYEASIKDKDILRIVCEQWGISVTDAEDRLVYEKRQAAIRSLRQYLKLQGYSKSDIDKFGRENCAWIRINREPDLWQLKNDPEKLKKEIEKRKSKK